VKQLTINIPDNQFDNVLNFLGAFPDSSILSVNDFIITPQQMTILDNANLTNPSDCLTKEDSLRLMREKCGL
jgi:hypothetical protein